MRLLLALVLVAGTAFGQVRQGGAVKADGSESGGGGSGTVTSVDASGGTTGLTLTGGPVTTSGTFTLGGTLGVANGGTGKTSVTAYGVLLGGTTSTGAFQSAAVGTSGQVLTSNGAGAAPTMQDASGVTGGTASKLALFTGGTSLTTEGLYYAGSGDAVRLGIGATPAAGKPLHISSDTAMIRQTDLGGISGDARSYDIGPLPGGSGYQIKDIGGGVSAMLTAGLGLWSANFMKAAGDPYDSYPQAILGQAGTVTMVGLVGKGFSAGQTGNLVEGRSSGGTLKAAFTADGRLLYTAATPTAASDACTAGTLWADASYVYVCTASGAIKRVAISTW